MQATIKAKLFSTSGNSALFMFLKFSWHKENRSGDYYWNCSRIHIVRLQMIILQSKPLDQFERFWKAQNSLKVYKCLLSFFFFFLSRSWDFALLPTNIVYHFTAIFLVNILTCTEISAHKGHMEGHYVLVTLTSGIVSITWDKNEFFARIPLVIWSQIVSFHSNTAERGLVGQWCWIHWN